MALIDTMASKAPPIYRCWWKIMSDQNHRYDLLFYRAKLPAPQIPYPAGKPACFANLQSSACGGGQCPPYKWRYLCQCWL